MTKHIIFDCDGTLMDTSGHRYKLFPGIKELLLDLSKDSKLYVWTARDKLSTVRYLSEFDVINQFVDISTPDDTLPKPHSEGIEFLVSDINKNSICIIGDSPGDIVGAKNFGVMSIGAAWADHVTPAQLSSYGADFIVSDPAECSKLIRLNLKES